MPRFIVNPAPAGRVASPGAALMLVVPVILALATAIECRIAASRVIADPAWGPSLLYGGMLWLWWIVLALALWRLGRAVPSVLELAWSTSAVHLLAAGAAASLHLWLLGETLHHLARFWPDVRQLGFERMQFFTPERFALELCIYVLIWTGCALARLRLQAMQDRMAALELERQVAAAKFEALQMQLRPHFLFNSLNAITTLVECGQGPAAVEALARLGALLKTTLAAGAAPKVAVTCELEFVENYLAIEHLRFSDRLKVDLNIAADTLDALVPAFLLQPVVENAIKHSVATRESGATIAVAIRRDGDCLRLAVRDNGPGANHRPIGGPGTGLRNIEQRLSHLYPSRYRFSAGPDATGGFDVSIVIPFERAHDA
jgi:signal transduction histidine kinase